MTKELAQTFDNNKLLDLLEDYTRQLNTRFDFVVCEDLSMVENEILNRMNGEIKQGETE